MGKKLTLVFVVLLGACLHVLSVQATTMHFSWSLDATAFTHSEANAVANRFDGDRLIGKLIHRDPGLTCIGNQSATTDLGACTYTHDGTAWDVTIADPSTVVSTTYTLGGATAGSGSSLAGVTFNAGITQVTWSVEDDNGDTFTCDFEVTVSIDAPIVIQCAGEELSNTPNVVAAVFSTTQLWSPSGNNAVTQVLNSAYGEGNWDHYNGYADLDPQSLFGGEYGYVYLNGSDNTANAFNAFITANRDLIEEWVSNGGHLYMHIAPNEGENIDLGFGGFTLQFNIGVTGNMQGLVQVPAHPIFNGPLTPANGNFAGGYFGHAIVVPVGSDYTSLIKGENGGDVLVEHPYGDGIVVFSGLTTPNFHSPAPNTYNWMANLHTYLEQPVIKPRVVAVSTDEDACTFTASGGILDPVVTSCNVAYTISHDYAGAPEVHTLDGTTFPLGDVTVNWTVIDENDNVYTCTTLVRVEDGVPPVISCGTDQGVDTDAGECTYTHSGTDWDATATDNCTMGSITYTLTGATVGTGTSLDGVTFELGETVVTWTATDDADNTDVCSFTVTVSDNEAPEALARDILVALDADGEAVITPDMVDNGSTDACGIAVLTLDKTEFGRSDVGINTVTLVAEDQNGNQSSITATVFIIAFDEASFVYDATEKSLSIAGELPAGVTVTYSGNEQVGVGEYPVTATVDGGDDYADFVLTATLEITPRALTITPIDQSKIYGETITFAGTEFAIAGLADGDDEVLSATIASAGSLAEANAGSYDITASDAQGEGLDNYTITYEIGTLTVDKASATITAETQQVHTYTGAAIAVQATLNHAEAALNYTPQQSYTNAGDYEVTVSAPETVNYLAVSNTVLLRILPANQTGLSMADRTETYNGQAHQLTVQGMAADATVVYVANGQTDAGEYEVTATISRPNHLDEVLTATLTITPGQRTLDFPALSVKTYGDADFNPGATSSSGEPVTYTSSNTAVAEIVDGSIRIVGVGSATITATVPESSNYTTRPSASQTLVVNKATQSITLDAPAQVNRDAGTVAITATASSGLPVSLSVDDEQVATLDGTTLRIHRLGTVRITATQTGDNNHEAAETVIVTVRVVDPSANFPVRVHQAVSPNGDGINEFLMIEGIRDYPENRVTIFNRNGTLLYEANGYDNNRVKFEGFGTGRLRLPAGTYFCVVEVRDTSGAWRNHKGYFVLRY